MHIAFNDRLSKSASTSTKLVGGRDIVRVWPGQDGCALKLSKSEEIERGVRSSSTFNRSFFLRMFDLSSPDRVFRVR